MQYLIYIKNSLRLGFLLHYSLCVIECSFRSRVQDPATEPPPCHRCAASAPPRCVHESRRARHRAAAVLPAPSPSLQCPPRPLVHRCYFVKQNDAILVKRGGASSGRRRRSSDGAMAASYTWSLKMMRYLNLTENISQQSYLDIKQDPSERRIRRILNYSSNATD